MNSKFILKISVILGFLLQISFAQEDSLSVAAKRDSAAAAYKIEALKQALGGDSYEPQAPINYQPPDLGNVVMRMGIGLVVILVLLYVLYILAKKIRKVETSGASNGQGIIELLDTKFLRTGKTVFLLKAGNERVIVVGATNESMRTLSEITGEEARYILEAYQAKPVTAAQFSATVDHLLRRFKREG